LIGPELVPSELSVVRHLNIGRERPLRTRAQFTGDVAQPTVSHHLKVLRETGWVSSERRGTWVWYRLRPEAVECFRRIAGGLAADPVASAGRILPVLQPGA